jgi:molecular chaperone Hsp33
MTQAKTPAAAEGRDRLTRYLLEQAGVRGVHVLLDDTWRQIRGRAEYPTAVAELLGQAATAAALFAGHLKVEGRLSVQLRGEGAVRTLFAECTHAGTMRGIATMAEGAEALSRDLHSIGPGALLAITIENPGLRGQEPTRYQGLVALDSDSLSHAFEGYFNQSEQLPTRLLLACGDDRACGLLLQKLPGDEGDADGWNRISALFDTLNERELLDTSADELLFRLFHEDGVRLLGERPLSFACSCSRERVEAMLVSLGAEEAMAAATGNAGVAEIRCEFCGEAYRYDTTEVAALFVPDTARVEAPERLQ